MIHYKNFCCLIDFLPHISPVENTAEVGEYYFEGTAQVNHLRNSNYSLVRTLYCSIVIQRSLILFFAQGFGRFPPYTRNGRPLFEFTFILGIAPKAIFLFIPIALAQVVERENEKSVSFLCDFVLKGSPTRARCLLERWTQILIECAYHSGHNSENSRQRRVSVHDSAVKLHDYGIAA